MGAALLRKAHPTFSVDAKITDRISMRRLRTSYCVGELSLGFSAGPFLLPGAPLTPTARSECAAPDLSVGGGLDAAPASPELLPLLEAFGCNDGPFLLPGAPFTPTASSEGDLAFNPVSTPDPASGASAAHTGAEANMNAKAVAVITFFITQYPCCFHSPPQTN